MRAPDPLDHHDPLTCGDLPLDHKKLDLASCEALEQLTHLLTHYFGRVQIRPALDMGLEVVLGDALHAYAQRIADVISTAYTEQALSSARQATANMFEALAAGALATHRAVRAGESTGDLTIGFATIAACEGRPEVLRLADAECGTPADPSTEHLP